LDQADGLRRLLAHAVCRFVPWWRIRTSPWRRFARTLCTAFAEHGKHTLVVDAGERSPVHAEMATMELAECIEPLSSHVSYLAARALPIKFVDTHGSTASFLQTPPTRRPMPSGADPCVSQRNLPHVRQERSAPVAAGRRPPQSVTHAYAAMKMMTPARRTRRARPFAERGARVAARASARDAACHLRR